MGIKRKIATVTASSLLIVVLLIAISYMVVSINAQSQTFDDVSDIPHNKVGLLLATSPITPGGAHNYYFDNRIKAADELYKAGKIEFIIGIFS